MAQHSKVEQCSSYLIIFASGSGLFTHLGTFATPSQVPASARARTRHVHLQRARVRPMGVSLEEVEVDGVGTVIQAIACRHADRHPSKSQG